jgi:DNA-binding GntR family transcriptional regulator
MADELVVERAVNEVAGYCVGMAELQAAELEGCRRDRGVGFHGDPLEASAAEVDGSTMQVYRWLRSEILRGALPPGGFISQARVAAKLGISRSPLREALRLLQNEGLVTGEHNRRMTVAPLTSSDLEDIYVMRLLAEPFGVQVTVPNLTNDELDAILAANAATNAALQSSSPMTLHEPHRRFHMLLCAHAGPRLLPHIEDLWDFAERYRHLTVIDGPHSGALHALAAVEHDAIAAAARDRDGDRCSDLLATHLARVGLTIVAMIDPDHDARRLRKAIGRRLGAPPTEGSRSQDAP